MSGPSAGAGAAVADVDAHGPCSGAGMDGADRTEIDRAAFTKDLDTGAHCIQILCLDCAARLQLDFMSQQAPSFDLAIARATDQLDALVGGNAVAGVCKPNRATVSADDADEMDEAEIARSSCG